MELTKNPLTDKFYLKELQNEVDPIESDIAILLKNKLFKVYTAVKYHGLYISNNLLKFKDEEEPVKIVHFPSALISAYLVNRSSTLVSGASGSGKTSTIRYIDRLMTGSSITDMENIIHCDKELQKEDWLGFLDPRKVIKGEGGWEVEWSKWTDGSTVIFDEVTRANSNFQNTALLLMNDGRIQHNVKFSKILPEIQIFMTENPRDEMMGNIHVTPLSRAFLDRITQHLIVESPSKRAMNIFDERRTDERNIGYDENSIVNPLISSNELRIASILSNKIPVDKEADSFAINLSKNADLCLKAPLFTKSLLQSIKPSNGLCEGCHFENKGYCKNIYGSSMRMYKDLIAMGKAYAFWLGLSSVSKYLINAISPDIISHRLIVPESSLRKDKGETDGDKTRYIEKNYIQVEMINLSKRKKCEESFQKLIYGKGTDQDLNILKNTANNDLFVRLELLPIVTVGINLRKNILDTGNKESYSCMETEYKNLMRTANEAFQSKNDDVLLEILNTCGSSPMNNLIQDLIHGYLRKLNFKAI